MCVSKTALEEFARVLRKQNDALSTERFCMITKVANDINSVLLHRCFFPTQLILHQAWCSQVLMKCLQKVEEK